MKNDTPNRFFKREHAKVRIVRLENGLYKMPSGHEPAYPFPQKLFEEFEKSGYITAATHEVYDIPYRKARFQQHLADRLAQIEAAKIKDIAPED